MLQKLDLQLLEVLSNEVICYQNETSINANLRRYSLSQIEHALKMEEMETKLYLEDAFKRGIIIGKYFFSHCALFEYHANFSSAPDFVDDDFAKLVEYFDMLSLPIKTEMPSLHSTNTAFIPLTGMNSLDSTKKIFSESSLQYKFGETDFNKAMDFFKNYNLIMNNRVKGAKGEYVFSCLGNQFSFTHSSFVAYHQAKMNIPNRFI